jgi:transposase, IS30 family
MKKHNKITAPERDQIAWWLACGVTIREMARRLGRSPSSISEELKRNQADGVYGSIKAHQAAEARKRNSHQKYLLRHRPALRDFVLEKLKLGWSPQQISGRLKKEITEGMRPKREEDIDINRTYAVEGNFESELANHQQENLYSTA